MTCRCCLPSIVVAVLPAVIAQLVARTDTPPAVKLARPSESTAKHWSFVDRPASNPPPTRMPRGSRAFSADAEVVIPADVLAEVRRRLDDRLRQPEGARLDGRQPADLIAAAVRQPRIARRRHAELIEVRRRDALVVGHALDAVDVPEVAAVVEVVAAVDRHAARELVLDLRVHVPVVVAVALRGPRRPTAARAGSGGRSSGR